MLKFATYPVIFATVKPFFFILSCFMLYLSCLPCGDGKECNVNTETSVSATDNHQQHEHQSEACTPFCTCSCCAASAFYSPHYKTQATNFFFPSDKHPLFNEAAKTDVFYAIWQPPQLS